jgi:hypothetical protein
MAQQPKPEREAQLASSSGGGGSSLDQLLKLVDQLPPEDLLELRRQLDSKTWGERFRQLVKDVAEDTKDEPPLTDEEIAQEVMTHRREKRAQGA